MVRVLQVIGCMDVGGAETLLMNVYRNIDKTKVQFDFLVHTTRKGFYDSEIVDLGGRIFSIERFKGYNFLSYYSQCKLFFRNHPEYKIVHGHIGSCSTIYLYVAHKFGCYTIAHSHSANQQINIHDVLYRFFSFPTRFIADKLFGCSLKAGEVRFGHHCIHSSKYSNFNNAIELSRFEYNEATRDIIRKRFGFTEKTLVLGTVGRLTEAKNPFFLYEIFKQACAISDNVKCLWVGGGIFGEKIKKLIDDDRMQDGIVMLGNQKDSSQYYMAFDCFVFPSKWEGLPTSLVEAQASGLRCIISDAITKEIVLTDLITTESIAVGSKKWAEKAIELAQIGKERRCSRIDDVRKAGYDIKDESKRLEAIYLSLGEKNEKVLY